MTESLLLVTASTALNQHRPQSSLFQLMHGADSRATRRPIGSKGTFRAGLSEALPAEHYGFVNTVGLHCAVV